MTIARRLMKVARGGGSLARIGTGVFSVGSPSTVTDDGYYNAWPVVCRMANGSLILGYTKANDHHTDTSGKAVGRISANDGTSWGAEFDIYDHASKFATVYGLGVSSSGRLFASLWRDTPGTPYTGEAGLVYSDDDGATWSAWYDMPSGFTQDSYTPGPVVQLPGGDLLVTIEGNNTGQTELQNSSHTLRSTDDGLTWGSEVTVRNYVTDSRPYYESKLLWTPDALLCIHRTSALTGTHYISRSTDNGLTWAAPTSEFDGYGAPSSIRCSTRTLLAVTRQNSDAACVAFASTDNGDTWGSAIVIDDTMYQMEYGCPVECVDGRILVVYGSQPTSAITNSDIKQAYLTETLA